ncbi:hypothetical protein BMF94_0997 [Rhodotorula taiwanensis]|uniref:DUF4048 domain-containing protein n=1 Tax=Rhodotorula taiwanensis TaxID=741276 RepID=A0A2S5BGM4_9BASI|nr:hypothetical protein BMF94_0997 [Rhodotorula taiwanensis]
MNGESHAVSTPPSASSRFTHSAAPSSSSANGKRHLKRLSLSGAAFSPVSPNAITGTESPEARGPGASPHRHLNGSSPLAHKAQQRPASVAGAPSPNGFAQSPQTYSATRGDSPSLLRRSTSYRTTSAREGMSASIGSSGGTASHPASTPEHVGVAAEAAEEATLGSGHATPTRTGSISRRRRGPSISYTGAFSPSCLSLESARPSQDEPRPSLDGLSSRTSALGLADVPESGSLAVPDPAADQGRLSPASSAHSPALSATSSSVDSVPAAAHPAASTLLEQNADLLSVIAKKERKCLDLREELKRNEAELATLKNRWQAIVARSLQQQAYQPYVSSSHRHSPSVATTASTASPNTSPTPKPALLPHSAHSLDFSLLTSTFEPADYDLDGIDPAGARHVGGDASPIPETVKAAGSWLGGALGRVLEAAVGIPPPSEEEGRNDYDDERNAATRTAAETGLGIVPEEDEEDEAAPRRSPLVGSTSPDLADTALQHAQPHPAVSSPPIVRVDAPAVPGRDSRPPSSSSPSTSPTHTRTRSAFSGLLSDRLSSRWAALSSSEMVQNSKRATLGLVDTFEQGLAHALGPLEPPPLPPMEQRRGEDRRRDEGRSSNAVSATSPAARPQRLPMPGATPGQGFAALFASASSTSAPSTSTRLS